ncbi:hypothetical protein [Paenibacillus bovis]|uniref:Uncharacterized protein n=1 Tax=Paenibacillus bovis TaxID=1616788 RepID=A0A172ZIC6_9BACL|nr:hypothetical protein [Paenibacillus bovis]ANF96890.1 hypothetical protein AR543_13320 [Paenibacillus bovis]
MKMNTSGAFLKVLQQPIQESKMAVIEHHCPHCREVLIRVEPDPKASNKQQVHIYPGLPELDDRYVYMDSDTITGIRSSILGSDWYDTSYSCGECQKCQGMFWTAAVYVASRPVRNLTVEDEHHFVLQNDPEADHAEFYGMDGYACYHRILYQDAFVEGDRTGSPLYINEYVLGPFAFEEDQEGDSAKLAEQVLLLAKEAMGCRSKF